MKPRHGAGRLRGMHSGNHWRRIAVAVALGLVPVMSITCAAQTDASVAPARAAVATTLDGRTLTPDAIDQSVTRAMANARVTGVAVALINNGTVVYQRAYGLRNAETREPLTTASTMYAASFTTAMFAHLVMQLVEKRTLDLDRPIVDYTGALDTVATWADMTSDPRHRSITARMLLSHTSGFSNYRITNPGEKLLINFEPGSRYAYSGEGLNLLQYVIEHITGQTLDVLMRERVFRAFGMRHTSMIWDDAFTADLAVGHDSTGQTLGHRKRLAPRAAGSAESNIGDMGVFMTAILRGDGLHPGSRRTMLTPKVRIRSDHQFPTLDTVTTTRDDAIRLSYGLGWGLFTSSYGPALFKEGHDDGTGNYMIGFDRNKSGIVIMSNSDNADHIIPELVAVLLGDRQSPWRWNRLVPFTDPIPAPATIAPPASR
jgi:CubicO group peptidase (beta-lactamase class C family)